MISRENRVRVGGYKLALKGGAVKWRRWMHNWRGVVQGAEDGLTAKGTLMEITHLIAMYQVEREIST